MPRMRGTGGCKPARLALPALFCCFALFLGIVSSEGRLEASAIQAEFIATFRGHEEAFLLADALEREEGVKVLHKYKLAGAGFAFRLGRNASEQKVLERLRATPSLLSLEPNREVRATGPVPLAYGETINFQHDVTRLRSAWRHPANGNFYVHGGGAVSTSGPKPNAPAIAIFDTGIFDHTGKSLMQACTSPHSPSCNLNVPSLIPPPASFPHADLYVIARKDCINTVNGTANDKHGHGTHCAGNAAAMNNGRGIVGTVRESAILLTWVQCAAPIAS